MYVIRISLLHTTVKPFDLLFKFKSTKRVSRYNKLYLTLTLPVKWCFPLIFRNLFATFKTTRNALWDKQATARCVTVDLSSALVNYQWCDKNLKIIFFNCKTLPKLGRTRKHHFSFSLRLITLIFYELDTNAKNFFCFLNIKDICCCKEREDRIIRFVPHLLELYSVYKDILVQSSVKPLLF